MTSTPRPRTLRTVAAIRDALSLHRAAGTVGLVPTMGAFHAGHSSLFDAARRDCDLVVVSLFVNPSQFGDPADLAAYPRDQRRDEEIATRSGVDFIFAPDVDEMYPRHYASWIDIGGPAVGLEGHVRPGHFRGVATVCLKLFSIVRPDVAYFGQKDAQQVAVVKQMARDFHLELQINVCPTVRGSDGLALSSRNVRLSAEDRQRALAIPRALRAGRAAYARGDDPRAAARGELQGLPCDYVEVTDFDGRLTLAIAARIGTTRLIDNLRLDDGDDS